MIPVQEVIDVIKDAVNGKVPIVPVRIEWNAQWCGDVPFMLGDWRIEFYNDCDELDYVERVAAPDGRTGEYNDWEHDPIETMWFTEDFPYIERLDQMLMDAKMPEDAIQGADGV